MSGGARAQQKTCDVPMRVVATPIATESQSNNRARKGDYFAEI
jgi:hypothetical protein